MARNFSLSGTGLGIYLIALGVAYFVNISSGTDYIGTIFKLYPVLLVLLGLDYILSSINREVNKSRRPEGWVVTIIILITIGGLSYSVFKQTLNTNWPDFKKAIRLHGNFNFDKYEEKIDTRDFQLPGNINNVRIENSFGDIQVNLNENAGRTVNTSAVIRFPVYSREKIDSYHEQLVISGETFNDLFLIKLEQPRIRNNQRATASITVTVPPGVSVEVENSFGKINITEVRGNLKIENSNGRIEVEKVTGDAVINNRFSRVDIGEISGSLKIDVTTGGIDIGKVGGTLTTRNSFGSLEIGVVSGATKITSSNSKIQVEENNGPIEIENSFGDVSLKNCGGPITAKLSNGRLQVNANKFNGPYDIDVKFGGVALKIPSGSNFSLDAKTSFGNINSDFDITMQKEMGEERATGNINGGGPLIKIKASNGNISLNHF